MATRKVIVQLKSQIRDLRAKLDPKVLDWAQSKLRGDEAYDKDAARKAIEIFIAERGQDPRFLKKLKEKLADAGAESPKGKSES